MLLISIKNFALIFFTIGFLLKKTHDSAWQFLVSAQVFYSQVAWFKKERSDAFAICVLTFVPQFGQGACPETVSTCSTVLTSIPITRRMNCKGETRTKHHYVQNKLVRAHLSPSVPENAPVEGKTDFKLS